MRTAPNSAEPGTLSACTTFPVHSQDGKGDSRAEVDYETGPVSWRAWMDPSSFLGCFKGSARSGEAADSSAIAVTSWASLLSVLSTVGSLGDGLGTWLLRATVLFTFVMPTALLLRALGILPLVRRLGAPQSFWLWTVLVFLPLAGLSEWVADESTSATLLSRRGALLRGILWAASALIALISARWWIPATRFQRLGARQLLPWGGLVLLCLLALAEGPAQRLTFWVLWVVAAGAKVLLTALVAATAPRLRAVNWAAGSCAVGAASLTISGLVAFDGAYARLGFERNAEFLGVIALRELADSDGDGFSPWFDGGDCDDDDPSAYPLGPKDCDGMMAGVPPAEPTAARLQEVPRVLLITIDAWRCELAGEDLCPDLTHLASSASYRGHSRTFSSQTVYSLAALLGGRVTLPGGLPKQRSPLLTAAQHEGYFTRALISYPALDDLSIGGSFASLDASMGKARRTESDVRSGAQTRKLLGELDGLTTEHAKLLLWTHYLDPHAPHTRAAEGEPVGYFQLGRIETYSAEVRRTVKDVADLIEGAKRKGFGRNAAIIVTGDHGESFEHGHYYHGHTSYNTEVIVPLLVWLYDAGGNLVPLSMPEQPVSKDVTLILASILGVPPPKNLSSATVQFGWSPQFSITEGNYKYIYNWKKRITELYDLKKDPQEMLNLTGQAPGVERRLRLRLGEELFHVLR